MLHKTFTLMLAAFLGLTLPGCAKESPRIPTVGEVSETVLAKNCGVVMEADFNSITSDELSGMFTLTNLSNETYYGGSSDFCMEVYIGGVWCDLTPAAGSENFAFADVGLSLPPGESTQVTYDWEWYGTQFDPGTYRVVTKVWYCDSAIVSEDAVVEYIAAEFTITQQESAK